MKTINDNRRGFTLIELLVCIGIIGALGIAAGVSANAIIKSTAKKRNIETMTENFEASLIYAELSNSTCNLKSSSSCKVSLNNLVQTGLLDKSIYNKVNPMSASSKKFDADIIVEVRINNGEKDVKYKCFEENLLYSNIKSFSKWGNC